MDGYREAWAAGDAAHFEYHCWESDDSDDAAIWHHSHQMVTVLSEAPSDAAPGSTLAQREDAATPRVYRVRFADGYEATVFEDELLIGPEWYERADPPAPGT